MKYIRYSDIDMPFPQTFVLKPSKGEPIKTQNLKSAIIKGFIELFHGKPIIIEEFKRQKDGSYSRVKVHTFRSPNDLPPDVKERFKRIEAEKSVNQFKYESGKRPEITSKWSLLARGPKKEGGNGKITWRNNETGKEGIKKKDGFSDPLIRLVDARLNNYDLERLERIKEADKKKQKEYITPKYPYTKKKNANTSLIRGLSSNLQNSTFGYGASKPLAKEDPYDATLRKRREQEAKQEIEAQKRWERQQGIIESSKKINKNLKSAMTMKEELSRRFGLYNISGSDVAAACRVYNDYIKKGLSQEEAFKRLSKDIHYGTLKSLKKDHAIRDFAVLGVVTALIPIVKSAMLSQVGGYIASRLFNKLLTISMKPGTLTDNVIKEIKKDGNELVRALKRNGNALYKKVEMLVNRI